MKRSPYKKVRLTNYKTNSNLEEETKKEVLRRFAASPENVLTKITLELRIK
jgi:hypothetical protein